MDERLSREMLLADLAGVELWRPAEDVAAAAVALTPVWRKLAPLGRRILTLPPRWSPAHHEHFLLLHHLVESLGDLRPQARVILSAFAHAPPEGEIPIYAPMALLADMIRCLDPLDRVAALPEGWRALFPLRLFQVVSAAEEIASLERWVAGRSGRAAFVPTFLWKLAALLELDLAPNHIFDRSAGEPGLLKLLAAVLA